MKNLTLDSSNLQRIAMRYNETSRPDGDDIKIRVSDYNESMILRKDCMIQFVAIENFDKLSSCDKSVENETQTSEDGETRTKTIVKFKGEYLDGENVEFEIRPSYATGDEVIYSILQEDGTPKKLLVGQIEKIKPINIEKVSEDIAQNIILTKRDYTHSRDCYFDYTSVQYSASNWIQYLMDEDRQVEDLYDHFTFNTAKESLEAFLEKAKTDHFHNITYGKNRVSLPDNATIYAFLYKIEVLEVKV